MGHKPGYEFRKHRASAQERGIDRKQFLDEHTMIRPTIAQNFQVQIEVILVKI